MPAISTGGATRARIVSEAVTDWIDRLRFWLLCGAAFFLPLIYLRDVHDEFVLPKVLFAQIVIALMLALYLVQCAATGVVLIRRTSLDLPILAFVCAAVVSTIFSINRNVAIYGTYGRYEGLLSVITYASLFWLSAQTIRGNQRAWMILRVMLASAFILSIIAVVQWVVAALTTTPPNPDTGFSYAGLPRASATMSNPTMLAAFLAMLLPVGASQFFASRSTAARILTANVLFAMSVSLALTFVRLAWLGALVGLAIAIAAPQRTPLRRRLALSGGAAAAVLAVVAIGFVVRGGLPLLPSLLLRFGSISVTSGSGLTRLHVWADALRVIASRPATGFGPDSFGIVYPRFRTGDWAPGFVIDKVPSDILQVFATMGVLGVASYLWVLAAAALAFWRGRRNQGAAALFGGLVAYQLWLQANFSWFPAASMYWIFLAAATCAWVVNLREVRVARFHPLLGLGIGTPVAAALVTFGILSAATGWAADVHFQAGLDAEGRGNLRNARAELDQARSLNPHQSQYAFDAGRVDLESADLGEARWPAAQQALYEAAQLGTYYAAVYYDLALADIQLGRKADAISALNRALELRPGDPATLALLRELTSR